jgi:AbiEi antitoxin C-terminal domain
MQDVYVHRDVKVTDKVRLEAVRLAAPLDVIVAGRTAAWLHGAWRPMPGYAVPLEVARPRKSSGSGLVGLTVSRWDSPPEVQAIDVQEMRGLRVTSPMRTCWDLASRRSLVEAVVVLDAFAHATLVELPLLAAHFDAFAGWRGIKLARNALDLASSRAASPGESRMRMVVVLAGFPEPYVNIPFETAAGTWLFRPAAVRGAQAGRAGV